MCRTSRPDPPADPARATAARDLAPARRRAIVADFFTRHRGATGRGLDLGRAIGDFQDWELDSGRVAADAGSPWWSTVNGLMLLDLVEAGDALRGGDRAIGPTARDWIAYARTDAGTDAAQAALWRAHQRSLHAAVAACGALAEREPADEQVFIDLVVEVVDRAARDNRPTDTGELGEFARLYYPADYPIDADELAALRRLLGSDAH